MGEDENFFRHPFQGGLCFSEACKHSPHGIHLGKDRVPYSSAHTSHTEFGSSVSIFVDPSFVVVECGCDDGRVLKGKAKKKPRAGICTRAHNPRAKGQRGR